MKKDFDIVIVGAGINGQVMSLAAAHAGFSVALIDQNRFIENTQSCLLYTSPSPRDPKTSRMPSSA